MKKILLLLLILSSIKIASQNSQINNYKYVIVANKFDFLKKPDQYQTSSLTKFLLKKNGFTVYMSDESLPLDLSQNKCLALFASVKDESSMLSIKSTIVLKDCKGNIVYTSKLGRSNLKEYKKAYLDAIRKAHNTMSDINYVYHISDKNIDLPSKEMSTKTILKNDDISHKKASSIKIEVLYAQSKPNGFQLINTKPEVVYVILNTTIKNVFIIKDKNGVLYKNEAFWIAEFYNNGKSIKEKYQIKF